MTSYSQARLVLLQVIVLCSVQTSSVTVEEIHCAIYTCDDLRCYNTLQTDHLPNLDISYNCSDPTVVSIVPPRNRNASFTLFHSDLCITSLPGNLCDYTDIVSIQVVNSSLKSIPNLSCLKDLVDLDLSYNDIEILRNDTFHGLTKLRNVDLGHNKINTIWRDTFNEGLPGLMYVRLGDNMLTTADGWPMKIGHPFCLFDVSNNRITRFSNNEKWYLDPTKTYGPGWYDFKGNMFSSWVSEELKIFGINELKMLGFLIEWVFDFRSNPWICDCKFYTFLKISSNYPDITPSAHFNLLCNSPSHLNGTLVMDVPLNQLVCNITTKCPSECLCQDQPDEYQLLVDCRGKGLRELPTELPDGNLKLLMSENSIKTLHPRPYLGKVISIDLSRNGLAYISSEALDLMLNKIRVLNVSHNDLKYLPIRIQDIENVIIDNNPFVCDCNSTWMARWMDLQFSNYASPVKCTHPNNGLIEVSRADDQFLQCPPYHLTVILSCVFGSLVVVCIAILIILIVFRYEITVWANGFRKRKPPAQGADDFDYDVFISVNDESDEDRIWVIQNLLPSLELFHHLSVYFPPRDTVPGAVLADEIIKALKRSRAAIILLSQHYLDSPSKLFEFSMIYETILGPKRGRIIILKFPQIRNIQRGHLKAFIRLKKFINVDNVDWLEKVLKDIDKDNGQINNNLLKIYATKL